MITFTYTITDASGIHARPAGLLVKQAAGFPCAITLQKGEKTADAKRIFAVMSLAAKQGELGRCVRDVAALHLLAPVFVKVEPPDGDSARDALSFDANHRDRPFPAPG